MRTLTRDRSKPTIIYMVTNLIDGKRYIGITCRYLSQRKSKHFYSAEKENSQTYFHRAIRKYGREFFKFSVMKTCLTYDEATSEEIRLIATLKPEYNQTLGGDGYLGWNPTKEHRQKISERMKGKPGHWTKETLPKSFHEGRDRWHREHAHEAGWFERRKLGPRSIRQKIVCLDDNQVFESIKEAATFYNIESSSISSVCRRSETRRTAGGLVFRYFGEHLGGRAEADEMRKLACKAGRKLSEPHYKKTIKCLDDGRIFESAKSASIFYGTHHGTITAVAKGSKSNHTAGGRRFEYLPVAA